MGGGVGIALNRRENFAKRLKDIIYYLISICEKNKKVVQQVLLFIK
jgi:hypothetical protein